MTDRRLNSPTPGEARWYLEVSDEDRARMKRAHRFLDACTTGSRMLSERGLSVVLTEPVLFLAAWA